MKTMCQPGYEHNGFVATHTLEHIMFGCAGVHMMHIMCPSAYYHLLTFSIYLYIYIYILYIYIYYIYIYIYILIHIYKWTLANPVYTKCRWAPSGLCSVKFKRK